MSNMFTAPQVVNRLQIEITTGCNLGCEGCQRTIGLKEGSWRNSHMGLDLYSRVIANAPASLALVLQGIGEPTLHPNLPEMISHARQTRKFQQISFNTNALVRDLAYYEDLKSRGLGHASVSVDSLKPELAEALRSGTDVEKLKSMIVGLNKLFNGHVTFSIVLSRRNLGELEGLIRELYALGGRVMEVQPLISYSGSIDPWLLGAADAKRAREIVARVTRDLPGLNFVAAPALAQVQGVRCRRPMRAVYVTVTGHLTPCCTTNDIDLFGRTSLAEMSFAEAWKSPGVASWLNSFFDKDDKICSGCAFNPNVQLGSPHDEAVELQASGRLDDAEKIFRASLEKEKSVDDLHQLGLVHLQRGESARAVRLLEAARELAPSARTSFNLANALIQLGRTGEAIEALRQAIAQSPLYFKAYRQLGLLLLKHDAAAAKEHYLTYLDRVSTAGQHAEVSFVLAGLEAVKGLLEKEPERFIFAANKLRTMGAGEEASKLISSMVAAKDVGALLTDAVCKLKIIYSSTEEVEERREQYQASLTKFADRVRELSPEERSAARAIVGLPKPFYLAYQGENDRWLQGVYGSALTHLMTKPGYSPPKLEGRIRVGFVSRYFYTHSVSKLFSGWIKHLDRSRFEVIGYFLGAETDPMTEALASAADHWRSGTAKHEAWTQAILADKPHVLIYPEIGMDGTTLQLAAQRLAPVQCVSWGHPETTGSPVIDYFLSSDLMETENGPSHYTEELVRLPNLSIAYDYALKTGGARFSRGDFGIAASDTAFICCQSLFKYQPRYDEVFTRIAARVPKAKFVFLGPEDDPTTKVFKTRLEKCFAAAGLNAGQHLRFIGRVAPERFAAFLAMGNVYLDSIGWSGGNTTLEAMSQALPVVTMPTELMRSRHTAAILRMMGLTDMIAASLDDYVDHAVRLSEKGAEITARRRIRESYPKLLNDVTPVRALETFLEDATRAALLGEAPARREANVTPSPRIASQG